MWLLLLALLRVFLPLSLLTIGGGQSVIPAIHEQVVTQQGWLSNQEFLDVFALSRLAPGPKTLLVALIGWEVAGFWGAWVAAIAIFLPSALLMYAIVRVWQRHAGKRWVRAMEKGLVPIAAGMVFAAAGTILDASSYKELAWVVALGSTALLLSGRVNPFVLLGVGGLVFVGVVPLL